VDAGRGWPLLPDAGGAMREQMASVDGFAVWEAMLGA